MDYAWRIALAALGLFWMRATLYRPIWGHSALLQRIIGFLINAGLMLPLILFDPTAGWILLIVGGVWILPYAGLVRGLLRSRARAGARRFAREWETSIREDPETGLFTVTKEISTSTGRKIWTGNVLTHVRSLHPGVRTQQTYTMLAFVVGLNRPPPFVCSLMKGWSQPQYFEKHWRQTMTMQGDFMGLNLGSMMSDAADVQVTGGKASDLHDYSFTDQRFGAFTAVRGTRPELFDKVFAPPFLDLFFSAAFQTVQFELDITPVSVSIYTTCCGPMTQKKDMDLLVELAGKIEALGGVPAPPAP